MVSGKEASFGALLRRHRVDSGHSQEALAERARLSARGISDLERGMRHPQPGTVARLVEALALEPEERASFEAAGQHGRVLRPPRTSVARQHDGAPLLVATKLAVPSTRADHVARARLIEQVGTGVRGPLTLLAAPAGYGKTTLITAWHDTPEARHVPLAWVSLDPGDNDPVLFWTTVFTALERAVPGTGVAALAALRSVPSSMVGILAQFVNRLSTVPGGADLVLVLDDYHVIDSEPIHQALTFLLDHLPPTLHLLVATRADPPFPLARLRARGALAELRADDLRFTPAEVAGFLAEVMGLSLPPKAIEALAARTEGWIAGLQLAALSLQGRSPEAMEAFVATFAGSNRHVVDYLVDEVLVRQSAPAQAFLLRTAILERLCAPLCAYVLEGEPTGGEPTGGRAITPGGRGSQERLEELEHRNVFLVALDDAREWYRYHNLFRDALRQRLGQALPPAEVALLHRRASTWLERHDLLPEAIEQALAGRAFEAASRLIAQVGWTRFAAGAPLETVGAWLQSLPDTVVRRNPRLCVLQAFLLADDRTVGAMEGWLTAGEQALEAADPTPVARTIRGNLAALRAVAATLRGDTPQAVAYGERALGLLESDAVLMRGVVWMSQGKLPAAVHWLQGADQQAGAYGVGRSSAPAPDGARQAIRLTEINGRARSRTRARSPCSWA
jgi:LuxR family maltose regulon positive regulatory protein